MAEEPKKEPVSREEARKSAAVRIESLRLKGAPGLWRAAECQRAADALQFLLDSEERKTKALERIAECPRHTLIEGQGWHITDIQDLQSIAEAALKPQEPQRAVAMAVTSDAPLETVSAPTELDANGDPKCGLCGASLTESAAIHRDAAGKPIGLRCYPTCPPQEPQGGDKSAV